MNILCKFANSVHMYSFKNGTHTHSKAISDVDYKHISLWAVLQWLTPFSVSHPGFSCRSSKGLLHTTQILSSCQINGFSLNEPVWLSLVTKHF